MSVDPVRPPDKAQVDIVQVADVATAAKHKHRAADHSGGNQAGGGKVQRDCSQAEGANRIVFWLEKIAEEAQAPSFCGEKVAQHDASTEHSQDAVGDAAVVDRQRARHKQAGQQYD